MNRLRALTEWAGFRSPLALLLTLIGVALLTWMLLWLVTGLLTEPMPACVTEDSTFCFWDATTHGAGTGRSFISGDEGDPVRYVD